MSLVRMIMAGGLLAGVLVAPGVASANSGAIVPNGAKVTATVTGPSDSAKFSFSGTAGDVVNLSATAGTFADGCDVSLELDDAFGRHLAGPVCAGSSAFLGSVTLPGTGGYFAEVLPNNGGAGSVQLRLSRNLADSSITENGPPVTFTATKPGQGRNFAFTGNDGDVVNVSSSNSTYPDGCNVEMQIVDNHRRALVGPVCAGAPTFLGSIVLPATGIYLIKITPGGPATGRITLTLSRNDADSTITVNGPPKTFTATKPGQGRNFAFTGNDGDVVNLSSSNSTYPDGCDVYMQLVDNHKRVLAGSVCAGGPAFLGSVVLPGTGTYFVQAVPGRGVTGSVDLTVSRNDADSTITVNGPPKTFTATRPGQGRNFAFTGNDGDVVNLSSSNSTYPDGCDVYMQLVDNHKRTLAGSVCAGGPAFLGSVVLPGTGTYFVQAVPGRGVTGSVDLTLSRNAADSTITINGPPVTFTANKPGQGRNYAFTGSAGEAVDLTVSGGTFPDACSIYVAVADSYGRTLSGATCAGGTNSVSGIVLPGTGTYLLEMIPGTGSTGSAQLHLADSP